MLFNIKNAIFLSKCLEVMHKLCNFAPVFVICHECKSPRLKNVIYIIYNYIRCAQGHHNKC